jgi:carnitine-CoA ligase
MSPAAADLSIETLHTVGSLLELRSEHTPQEVAVIFADGPVWTFRELRNKVRSFAGWLQLCGVRQGDYVLSWQPNGPLAVLTVLGLNYLGAVYVPINIALKGQPLEHAIAVSDARMLIAHGGLLQRLTLIDVRTINVLAVIGVESIEVGGARVVRVPECADTETELEPLARRVEPWDTHMVIFTSGTTGPSKGVLSTYRQSFAAVRAYEHVIPGDRLYTPLPMFHVGGVYGVLFCLIHGITWVLADSFRTSDFWRHVRQYGITTTGLMGTMAQFLLGQAPTREDRTHTLRKALLAPLDAAGLAFAARFEVELYTAFNMTELSVPLFAQPGPLQVGYCGKPRPGIQVRLANEHDFEVPEGSIGELLVRADEPWTLSHGYHNNERATAQVWRNGWFHTGDIFRRDAAGGYFFVDRVKDVVRRRGENISSHEVESAIQQHPAVQEVAVVAALAQGGEAEVLAVISPRAGETLDPAELLRFLEPKLAHFMLPRFVRLVDRMPKTATHKIEKHFLRTEGITSDTWDREAAGVIVRGDKLERRG